MLDQFFVKLGHPYLSSMKAIPSTIHKLFKFPHNGHIITINHSLFQRMTKCEHFTLDYFWPKQPEPLQPQNDALFTILSKIEM